MKVLGHGIYDLNEAARYTGLKRGLIREWFHGRVGDSRIGPDDAVLPGNHELSFLDLVEVFVAGQLRNQGLTLPTLRRAHETLQKDWDVKHPFAKKDMRIDGKRIFACLLGDNFHLDQDDVRMKNLDFASVVLPVLNQIEYARVDDMAEKWHIAPMVVLDPTICFGKPILESVGITTRVIAESYFANSQNASVVANWFEIKTEQVKAAVDYESELAA